MGKYAEPVSVSCIVFNFGYLRRAIILLPQGRIQYSGTYRIPVPFEKGRILMLCIYSGGDSGFEERDALLEWLKVLDSRKFLVIKTEYYNRPNHPPMPVLVVKL